VDTSGTIVTVAGNGSFAFSGDGGPAAVASLNYPSGVAIDPAGNLLIADNSNSRIRRVDTNGIITTIAGMGSYGGTGDGRPATSASFASPSTIALDPYGNLFIDDHDNNRIRKVTNTQTPVLTLNNVSAMNSGNYQLIVTGAGGSITSSVATLTVTSAPFISATIPNPDGSVTMHFVAQPGSTNVVLSATNLLAPVYWQSLSTNVAAANGQWQYTDTNTFRTRTLFYRSLTQ
jgi:hypothetical protein